MDHCLSCGATLAPPTWTDVYCRPCLDAVCEALTEALLEAFLSCDWLTRRPRCAPTGETHWWMGSA
jgi:hypothetical protein